MLPNPPLVARFGAFEVNLAARELRRAGVRVKLQDQPFDILIALLERPGEIVSREELRQLIWGGSTFVDFDRCLATAVNRLRHALGDSATSPRYIETIPKHGYRFIYPLSQVEEVRRRTGAQKRLAAAAP